MLPEVVIEEKKKELIEAGSEFKGVTEQRSKPSEFEEEMEEDVSR